MLVAGLCERAGVASAPWRVVPVDATSLRAASADLREDARLGTVWSGDARDGINGGGNFVRWVVDEADASEAFAFFADPRNLEAITPPWLGFRILEAPATLEQGSLLGYRLPARPRPWKRTRRSASERAIRCTLRRLETERTRVT